jgi:hypothetical protein
MYLKMKALKLQRVSVLVGLGVSAIVLAFPAVAGDKIIVSEDKPAANPNLKLGDELFKTRTKFEHSPFDHGLLGMPTLPRANRLSRKEEDQLKAKEAERKNWMFVNPGELQQKQEEGSTLGVENNPLAGLEKKDSRANLMFYGVGEQQNTLGQRLPGQLLTPSEKQEQAELRQAAQQQRERMETEDDSRRSAKSFDLGGSKETGAHTASELNFGKLLDPSQNDLSAAAGKANFSLRSLMGTAPVRTKEQQARADDFNKLINIQPQQSQSPFGMGSTLGPAQPAGGATPTFGSRLPEPSAPRPSGSELFNQSPASIGSTPNRLNPPGLPNLNNPAYNPYNSYNPASPFQRQTPAASESSKSWMKPVEVQRRKF